MTVPEIVAAAPPPVAAALQGWIAQTVKRFQDAGLDVTVEADLGDWVAHMRTAPGIGQIAPTYNPELSRVSPENAYWIRVRRDGVTRACIVARLFEGELVELTRSYRVWYDRRPTLIERPVTFAGAVGRDIAGRFGITGGLWVHPDERGSPLLARYLPRLCMVLSIRTFDTAWDICMVRERLVSNRFTSRVYGYTRVELFLDGWYPPLACETQIFLGSISRDEIVRMIGGGEPAEPLRKRA